MSKSNAVEQIDTNWEEFQKAVSTYYVDQHLSSRSGKLYEPVAKDVVWDRMLNRNLDVYYAFWDFVQVTKSDVESLLTTRKQLSTIERLMDVTHCLILTKGVADKDAKKYAKKYGCKLVDQKVLIKNLKKQSVNGAEYAKFCKSLS